MLAVISELRAAAANLRAASSRTHADALDVRVAVATTTTTTPTIFAVVASNSKQRDRPFDSAITVFMIVASRRDCTLLFRFRAPRVCSNLPRANSLQRKRSPPSQLQTDLRLVLWLCYSNVFHMRSFGASQATTMAPTRAVAALLVLLVATSFAPLAESVKCHDCVGEDCMGDFCHGDLCVVSKYAPRWGSTT